MASSRDEVREKIEAIFTNSRKQSSFDYLNDPKFKEEIGWTQFIIGGGVLVSGILNIVRARNKKASAILTVGIGILSLTAGMIELVRSPDKS